MDFFSSVPQPERLRPPQPPPMPEWVMPPSGEMPGIVPLGLFLHRSADTVMTVESARVYSNGATLEVKWVRRRRGQSDSEWDAWTNGGLGRPRMVGADESDLRFGIQFPDGTKVIADSGPPRGGMPTGEPDGPVVRVVSRGGNGNAEATTGTASIWIWPLPVEGLHHLVTEWRNLGIPESSVEFDGTLLRDAAGRVENYWTGPGDPYE